MGEAGDRERFLLEPPQPVGIASKSRAEHLDRHVPLQSRVVSAVDGPHPTSPQEVPNGEVVQANT